MPLTAQGWHQLVPPSPRCARRAELPPGLSGPGPQPPGHLLLPLPSARRGSFRRSHRSARVTCGAAAPGSWAVEEGPAGSGAALTPAGLGEGGRGLSLGKGCPAAGSRAVLGGERRAAQPRIRAEPGICAQHWVRAQPIPELISSLYSPQLCAHSIPVLTLFLSSPQLRVHPSPEQSLPTLCLQPAGLNSPCP